MQYIIANWKMNGCFQLIDDFLKEFLRLQEKADLIINTVNTDNFQAGKAITIIMCLPFTHLYYFQQQLERKGINSLATEHHSFLNIKLGAQDCATEASGAYTGDISAQMLKEVGVKYVIIGHAERRKNHCETNLIIRKKAQAAINAGLIPIICLGDSHKETKEKELAEQTISLPEGLAAGSAAAPNFLIAYEPIYAIGSEATPSNEEIEKSFAIIEKYLGNYTDIHINIEKDNNIGNWPLIYGGAVNGRNIELLKGITNISGVLVGGASLSIKEFKPIIEGFL